MKKLFLLLFSIIIILGAFYFSWLNPRYVVPILTYHNIGYGHDGFYVSPENFTKQMGYIKKNGYEVITLDELIRGIKDKKGFKRNKVVITFDDGYKDNFEYAYPVLKRFDFPATIFIITDLIDKSSMGVLKKFLNWNEVIAISKEKITFGGHTYIFTMANHIRGEEKKFLNWNEVRIMSKDGVFFGAHTKSHFYLGSWLLKDDEIALEEIAGSKKAIEQKIGMPVDYFCYPGGGFNAKAKELVIQAGYKGACTTNRGFAKFNSDVYELKRIKITNSDATKPFSFWAKLSGYYTVFKKQKNPY